MYNHSEMGHRGRRRRRHRGSQVFQNDEFGLSPRLSYLTMLMRRSDAGRGHGRGSHAGGFRGQGRALHVLGMRSPISQKELAYVLGIRSQSLAELITKLEAAGMVTRGPDPDDRRTHLLELTAAGREAVEAQKQEVQVDPFETLSDEEKTELGRLLDRVIAQMEESLPGGPDPRMQRFKELAFQTGPLDEASD